MHRPAAAEPHAQGWGSAALRRATLTLALSQLISWGVLFYGFAVVAPEVSSETGWTETAVSGAFSLALLLSGLAAPAVARTLADRDPRLVMAVGSAVGAAGMLLFAAAPSLPVFYAAWAIIGLAMAATLYEPAMVVLVALDPSRRLRTLTVVTVAGGLASTAFAPLTGALADALGWRTAIAILAVVGGAATTFLHAIVLPSPGAHRGTEPVEPVREVRGSRALARLRTAMLFEQAVILATTVHLVGVLTSRGVPVASAAVILGAMGVGKVAGRLLLLGPTGRAPLHVVAASCSIVQLGGLALPLVTTASLVLLPTALFVGAASGATTVLRPLLIVDLVGPAPFAAVSARVQRLTTVPRSAAPFVLGGAAAAAGWTTAWALALAGFAIAAERYLSLGRREPVAPVA